MPALVLTLALLILTVGYFGLLGRYRRAVRHEPPYPPAVPDKSGDLPFLSVLVPARDEATVILNCLAGLAAQDYPSDRYEIILIDDHSTDGTAELVAARFPEIRVLSLREKVLGKGKKAALTYGIRQSRGDLIVTTDADCLHPTGWLSALADAHLSQGCAFICAPVCIHPARSFLDRLQALDLAGYMLLTAGGVARGRPVLANGANLAFSPQLFRQLGGYSGLEHVLGGDDVLLLQRARLRPDLAKIGFVSGRRALVSTLPAPGWAAFWRQRLRWAAKSRAYTDGVLVVVQGWTWLLCGALLFVFPLAGLLESGLLAVAGLSAWVGKGLFDYFFLRTAVRHFGRPGNMAWFPLTELAHTAYIFAIGAAALAGAEVSWRGRSREKSNAEPAPANPRT
ncbi:MAG: glycosyltransferase [Saprospiraceae bacterium]